VTDAPAADARSAEADPVHAFIDKTLAELEEERAGVAHLLG